MNNSLKKSGNVIGLTLRSFTVEDVGSPSHITMANTKKIGVVLDSSLSTRLRFKSITRDMLYKIRIFLYRYIPAQFDFNIRTICAKTRTLLQTCNVDNGNIFLKIMHHCAVKDRDNV